MKNYSLFKFDPTTVKFDELDGLGFDWFKSNANILDETFYDDVNPYYGIYAARGVKPFYHLSLSYNTAMGERAFRFLIVVMDDGDTVFIPYKVIQILKTKQIRFFNMPVSKNGDTEHEKTVFDKLKTFDFVKFVLTESERTDGCVPLVEYNDYYFTLDDKTDKYASGKYRSKNYINCIFKNKDVRLEYVKSADVRQLRSLREQWKSGMVERGSSVSKQSDKMFDEIMSADRNDKRYILIYYKSVLVSMQMFLIDDEHGWCDCLYIHHVWNDNGDPVLHRITQNITEIQKYMCHLFLYLREGGIRTVYLAGCRPTEHRLLKHKERVSDGKITYYLLNKN